MQAHEAVRVGGDLTALHVLDVDEALGPRHRRLDAVGQALAQVVAHHQAVDHDRDVVLVLLVEDDVLLEPAQLAVHLHAREALGAQLLEELAVLALAPPHHRRQHHELGALGQRHHLVDDLLGRLRLDRAAAVVAVRMAHPGPQQAQVVVDLGDRAHRRARVAGGGLLVDRDRRRQALDRVHVRLVHLAQELARVGRQRLDVAALALGVDRVEGEARLAGSRQPRDHDQGVARQPQVKVLEVVLAGTRDDDFARLDQANNECRAGFGSNVCSLSAVCDNAARDAVRLHDPVRARRGRQPRALRARLRSAAPLRARERRVRGARDRRHHAGLRLARPRGVEPAAGDGRRRGAGGGAATRPSRSAS